MVNMDDRQGYLFQGMVAKEFDAKARLIMPGSFRSQLSEEEAGSIIAVPGHDPEQRYFEIWPLGGWQQRCEEVNRLVEPEAIHAMYIGYISRAMECKLDRQGRMVLPQFYRDWAGMNNEVLWIGVGSKMELWAKERFEAIDDMLRAKAHDVWLKHNHHFSS